MNADLKNTLNERQAEVVRLLSLGMNIKGIAALLGLSPKTVEYHKHNAGKIIGTQNPVIMTRFALLTGMTTLTERVNG
jgi:DNA-binding NarL/FixJ family response regulator